MTRGKRVGDTCRNEHGLALWLIASDTTSMILIVIVSTIRENRHNFEDLVRAARTLKAVVALYHLPAFLATHAKLNLSIASRLWVFHLLYIVLLGTCFVWCNNITRRISQNPWVKWLWVGELDKVSCYICPMDCYICLTSPKPSYHLNCHFMSNISLLLYNVWLNVNQTNLSFCFYFFFIPQRQLFFLLSCPISPSIIETRVATKIMWTKSCQ